MPDTLLLTATITPPPGVPFLSRTDPQTRLRDYAESMRFYLSVDDRCIDRIVFIENSASDLSELQRLVDAAHTSKQVEFITFDGLDHPPSHGRGYGEFKLLDQGLERSKLIGEQDRLWKVTGRYRALNLARMVRTAPADFELYCDMKNHPRPWMDLRIFACTLSGYNKLLRGRYHELRDDVNQESPEIYLRKKFEQFLGSHKIVPRFRVEPYIAGIRGYDQKDYSRGKNLLLYWMRVTSRKLAPKLWI